LPSYLPSQKGNVDCKHPNDRLDYQPAEPDVGLYHSFAICEVCGETLDEDELKARYEPDWDAMVKEE
tara:strand:- start:2215 stop:2415 length:201 start_codon:yes stop_codon:yes gene_type:complete